MAFLLFFVVILFSVPAFAGTGGTEFQEIYTTLTDWTTGYLGKALAAGLFLTAMAIGIVRQSLMAIVLGIGCAMAVNYTPTILDAVVTALI
jgi:conjugal transfer pilus assembly protein TraA